MSRNVKVLSGAIALLLVAAVVAVLATPLYGVKEDTSSQEVLLEGQLAIVQSQLQVLETSLEVQRDGVEEARRTRELTEDLLASARATLDTAEQALLVAQQIRGDVGQIRRDAAAGLALLRELLEVARQTLQEVREINRKTGPAPGSSAPALP